MASASEITRRARLAFVNLSPVADLHDQHAQEVVFDASDDAVIADAVSPEFAKFGPCKASPMRRGLSEAATRS